jgi:hypothetical protein
MLHPQPQLSVLGIHFLMSTIILFIYLHTSSEHVDPKLKIRRHLHLLKRIKMEEILKCKASKTRDHVTKTI